MEAKYRVDVFFGRVTNNQAHVYVRLPEVAGGGAWHLSGRVKGPFCRHAQTLPLNAELRDLGAGETLIAQALVPDPCFWSPSLPAMYELEVRLLEDGRVQSEFHRSIGFRVLGTSGSNLVMESRRWVFRGVQAAEVDLHDLPQWRATGTCLVIENPSDELCNAASKEGVILAAEVTDPTSAGESLMRFSRAPAVAVVLMPDMKLGQDLRALAPNLMFARRFSVAHDRIPDGVDLLFADSDVLIDPSSAIHSCGLPLVAVRGLNEMRPILEARAACDQLQRDLAPTGDFAGYVV